MTGDIILVEQRCILGANSSGKIEEEDKSRATALVRTKAKP